MNKDQVKGVAKQVTGTLEESAGKLTNNKQTQVKGVLKQAEGKVEKAIGDAKENIKANNKKLEH